jgi:hypothetical protein
MLIDATVIHRLTEKNSNFIPSKYDVIFIEGIQYLVSYRTFDYDNNCIKIYIYKS